MPKLYKFLWTIGIVFIAITTIIVSFWIILGGIVLVSLFGIYRRFFPKKRSTKYHTSSETYTFAEIIDVKSEVVDSKIEVKNHLKK